MQEGRVNRISIKRAHERAGAIPSEIPSEKVDGIQSKKLIEKLIKKLIEKLIEARGVLGLVT
jgi:hypothetical protein